MNMSIRALLAGWILLAVACASFAQAPNEVNCIIDSNPPLLRLEGRSELIGDIVLNCYGGDPTKVTFIDFGLFLNTNVTSDLTDAAMGESEALLLIDDPQPGAVNLSNAMTYVGQVRGTPGVAPGFGGGPGEPGSGNVYVGVRLADNHLGFMGVPFVPPAPGLIRTLRFVNIRVDATQFPAGTDGTVRTLISANAFNVILRGGPQVVVGRVQPSLAVSVANEAFGFEVRFEELFPSAFQKRIENTVGGPLTFRQQGIPGNHQHFTESGFNADYAGLTPDAPGVADNGTRFVAQFNNLPPGVYLAAPSSFRGYRPVIAGPSSLEVRRVVGFNADFSGGTLLDTGGTYDLVPIAGGQATLVYEVVAAVAPFDGVNGSVDLDVFHIPVNVVFAQLTSLGSATVSLGYAPANATAVMSAPAPEPRFTSTSPLNGLFEIDAKPDVLGQLPFEWFVGDPVPIVHRQVYDDPDPIVSSTLMVLNQTGGNWMSATPADVPITDTIVYSANPTGLGPGTYHAAITFRRQNTPEILRIVPALMRVNPQPEINLPFDSSATFEMFLGDPPPQPKILYVNARYKYLVFTISVSTASGGNWLSISPTGGSTPVNVQISVNPAGLGAGTYEGALSIRADNAVNSPVIFPVKLIIRQRGPVFSAGSVVNAASQLGGGVSPGEMVTFYGQFLGPPAAAYLQIVNGRLATELAGTKIYFDGVLAPLIAVSDTQSTCIVPYGVAGKQSVTVIFEYQGQRSTGVVLPVMPVWPGIFTSSMTGVGQAAVINQDGTVNSAANPAPRGTIVSIYVTGGGQTIPFGDEGALNSLVSPPVPVVAPSVRIGGRNSDVTWFGGAPGSVAGFIQINALVGLDVTPGAAVPLDVLFGNVPAQAGATIAVE